MSNKKDDGKQMCTPFLCYKGVGEEGDSSQTLLQILHVNGKMFSTDSKQLGRRPD